MGRRSRTTGFRIVATAVLLALPAGAMPAQPRAPACPAALAGATRLVLVTADSMDTPQARLQTFVRPAPGAAWRPSSPAEPAVIGRAGMGWSHFFAGLAGRGEPIKVEGDRRAPAGVYRIGRSFGTLASSRPGYLHVRADTVCVDDLSSPAYNTIVSRTRIGPKVRFEDMSRILPEYRRGIVVDYPTNAKARAGSCIFIHVWKGPDQGTAGCIALPEPQVEALQDFVAPGAAIAIMPRAALNRMPGCLPLI